MTQEQETHNGHADEGKKKKRTGVGVRLQPVGNSDQPVFANYSAVLPAPGVSFIDFGFLEPGMLAALPRVVKQGGKLPEAMNGKLAVRVALSHETMAALHKQLGQLLAAGARRMPETKAD